MKQRFLLFLLICIGGALSLKSKLLRDKPCPEDRPVFSPLNLEKISGYWYLLYDYQTSSPEDKKCDCLFYEIELRDLNNCYVRGCCRDLKSGSSECDSIPKGLTFKSTPFDDTDETKGVFDGLNGLYFTMMDTDYDNFAVAYACRNLADGKSEEEIRIGSRTPQLNPDIRERVDKLIDTYFDRSMIRAIEHDESKCKGIKEMLIEGSSKAEKADDKA